MDGEVIFYDEDALEGWRPRRRLGGDPIEMASPYGQLLAAWNAANRRAIDAYDRDEAMKARYRAQQGIHDPETGASEEFADRQSGDALRAARQGLRAQTVATRP
jgi:hypothetical protein